MKTDIIPLTILTTLTDVQFLKEKCDNVSSIEEGEQIAAQLFVTLNKYNSGVGLAANQVGINKRVCVVNVKDPLYLINPTYKMQKSSTDIIYMESCLSFPYSIIRTKRASCIEVFADNIEGSMYIDVSYVPENEWMTNIDVLECVAIQHEIDHLNGINMFDNRFKLLPRHVDPKIGRNDKIDIVDATGQTLTIKYKQFDKYKELGWNIV